MITIILSNWLKIYFSIVVVFVILLQLLGGCSPARTWGTKRVLCRPTDQVKLSEYLDAPGIEWRRVRKGTSDVMCALRKLGNAGLGL